MKKMRRYYATWCKYGIHAISREDRFFCFPSLKEARRWVFEDEAHRELGKPRWAQPATEDQYREFGVDYSWLKGQ